MQKPTTQLAIQGEGGDIVLPADFSIVVKEGEEVIGEVQPIVGGVRILSPHLDTQMGRVFMEPQEQPSLRVVLRRVEIPPQTLRECSVRENLIEEVVEAAVRHVYGIVYGANGFTTVETSLAWSLVIAKLVRSQVLDTQRQVLAEHFLHTSNGGKQQQHGQHTERTDTPKDQ